MACCLIPTTGLSQSSSKLPNPTYVYHPASQDKPSWQRLNLWLSMNFYRGMKFSRIDPDSSLLITSRSLGLSRLTFSADGFDNPELLDQSRWFDERNPAEGVRLLSQAKGNKRLELMVLLGAYYAFQPGSYQYYKDSVEYYLKNAIAESKSNDQQKLKRVALGLLGKLYGQGRDTLNGNAVFTQLINECQSAGDKQGEARALAYRGLYTAYTPANMQKRIDYLLKSGEIYHQIGEIEGEIGSVTLAALLYTSSYRLDDAYNAFTKALHLADSIAYPYTHFNTDHLAMLTMLQGKFGEPLKYCLRSVKSAEATRDSIGLPHFYLRLAQLYYMEGGRSEESLKWMFKALERFIAINDGGVYSTLFNILSLMNESSGREQEALDLALNTAKRLPPEQVDDKFFHQMSLAICHMSLKKYDLALRFTAAADSLEKLHPAVTIAGSYRKAAIEDLITSIHFARGDYATAKKRLEKYLADNTRLRVLDDDIRAYQRLITIDSAYNDPASVANHYKKYIELLDSNFRASKIRQAEELQVMYQTQEKENEIALLNEQAKVEQSNLKQATLIKNVTIGGIAVALIIAGLLYRQSTLRKKNNQVITHKNDQLRHLLTEKEWLLKEIHHRAKNNLQIVMSLLNTQSAYIENDAALTAINDSQHRVQAMSLIHQKLYRSENVSSIDMDVYIRELASYLSDSFNTGNRIRFEFNIGPVEMDVSQAVPLGLIVNEAITNSIKYAFPDGKNGVISVSLSETSPEHYLLSVSDNGVGMPAHLHNEKPASLGMSLMVGLSEDLEGHFAMENHNGTTIRVSFVRNTVKQLISNNSFT